MVKTPVSYPEDGWDVGVFRFLFCLLILIYTELATTRRPSIFSNNSYNYFVRKSVADIYYINSDIQTRSLLKKLLMSFGILDITAMDCRNALTSPISDFEDAILSETTYRNGVEYIVTRNTKDFSRSVIPVITPAEFMTKITENKNVR
ncbi:MAG: PIN domain-containing protein [Clostridiales bacterium]|nr:PIN domain-containing protein [Clostridiales bacterium]